MKLQIREVEEVIVHLHLDEAFAFLMALEDGQDVFRGIQTAKVSFVTGLQKKSSQQWALEKKLCIGGGGDIDEHKNGKEARQKDMSATMLMAQALAITDPVTLAVVKEVNEFDSRIGCPKAHLASIIKMVQVNLQGSDRTAWNWSLKILRSVRHKLQGNLERQEGETPFMKFMTQLIDRQSAFDDPEAKKGLVRIMEDEDGKNAHLLLGLKHVYESLWRTTDSTEKCEEIGEDLLFALRILHKDQVNFHSFRREIKALVGRARDDVWFRVVVGDKFHENVVPAAIVCSDNPQAHNALRTLGAVITMVMNSRGNVTVQGNQRYAGDQWFKDALDQGITELCAMNRFCDMVPENRKSSSWSVLQVRGDCPNDPHWHLADKGWLSLYNGTNNYAGVPVTKLSRSELRVNAMAAFDPPRLREWRKRMNVPKIDWALRFSPVDGNAMEKLNNAM